MTGLRLLFALLLCRIGFHRWRSAPLGREIGGLADGFGVSFETCERCGTARVLDKHGRRMNVFKD